MIDPLGRRISASPMFDANGHGTHVAGTIAGGETPDGIAVGVAPKAQIHMGAVLVGDTTLRTLLEGIDWCVQKGSDVLNLSLGFNYYEPLFTQVFDVLIDQYEILPVVAIGNENQGNSSSPGNAHNALGVGAVEMMGRNRLEVAFFSSGASLVFPDLVARHHHHQAGRRRSGRAGLLGHPARPAIRRRVSVRVHGRHVAWPRRTWQAWPRC